MAPNGFEGVVVLNPKVLVVVAVGVPKAVAVPAGFPNRVELPVPNTLVVPVPKPELSCNVHILKTIIIEVIKLSRFLSCRVFNNLVG